MHARRPKCRRSEKSLRSICEEKGFTGFMGGNNRQVTVIPGIAPGMSKAPPLLLRPSSSLIFSRCRLRSSSTSLRASSRTSLTSLLLTGATISSSSAGGPRVFCFLGHRLGKATCCTRGSTHLSSIHACRRLSTSCAIFGMSWRRDLEPTRERTDRSRR